MRHGRLIRIGAAAVAAVAMAPVAAVAAPSPLEDTNFSGGTDTNIWRVEPGVLWLAPGVGSTFDGPAIPADWEAIPATVAPPDQGVVTVDGARLNPRAAPPAATSGVVEFRAKLGMSGQYQNVGVGDNFDDGPWAAFGRGAVDGGLFTRTWTDEPGATADDRPIVGIDPLEFHIYRIEWTDQDVKFYVDGTLVSTHSVALGGLMRPVISDAYTEGGRISVDWIGQWPNPNPGAYVSPFLEADDSRAVWGKITAAEAAGVTFETRSGNDAASMSAYQPVGAGGAIQSPPAKLIQYRATLSNADPYIAPRLGGVSITYAIDSIAPTTAIGSAGATGSTGKVTFSSPDADVARFECSLDGGAFATCTSPAEFAGLAAGSHGISVRAIDKAGNVGPAVSQTFAVTAPSPGGGTTADAVAPRMTLTSRKLRASSSGKVKLRLTCPADETSCKLSVRLKDGRRTIAFNRGTLAGGETGKVTLRLSSKGRKKLSRRGKLNLKAVVNARDAAGNRKKSKYSVTLRPR